MNSSPPSCLICPVPGCTAPAHPTNNTLISHLTHQHTPQEISFIPDKLHRKLHLHKCTECTNHAYTCNCSLQSHYTLEHTPQIDLTNLDIVAKHFDLSTQQSLNNWNETLIYFAITLAKPFSFRFTLYDELNKTIKSSLMPHFTHCCK